jgi:hypothetical protein
MVPNTDFSRSLRYGSLFKEMFSMRHGNTGLSLCQEARPAD